MEKALKLSEAIRAGAESGPQLFGCTSDGKGGSCALGAALIALGHDDKTYNRVFDYFDLASQNSVNPATGEPRIVLTVIRELNDTHRWTREQIADWVATIEHSEEA